MCVRVFMIRLSVQTLEGKMLIAMFVCLKQAERKKDWRKLLIVTYGFSITLHNTLEVEWVLLNKEFCLFFLLWFNCQKKCCCYISAVLTHIMCSSIDSMDFLVTLGSSHKRRYNNNDPDTCSDLWEVTWRPDFYEISWIFIERIPIML